MAVVQSTPTETAAATAAPESLTDVLSTSSHPQPPQGGPQIEEEGAGLQQSSQKKKKKKKSKKSTKAKEPAPSTSSKPSAIPDEDRPPVLCISRNKHWRYISSYHGPWLQLPLELLESLLILNLDPATLSSSDNRPPPALLSHPFGSPRASNAAKRSRGFASIGDHSSPDSPHNTFANLPPPPPLPPPKPGKATPPPIDPGVFRSVSHIRRLIDEASELSVRASSGLSAVALGSLRGGGSMFGQNPWGSPHALGMNGLGDGSNGRNVPMSATRIHRLRSLAVQKLAAAYKMDEIASSVMVMQGGSVFDDIAERVLKVDPNDNDARYVHFFHEKIPSRSTSQLAESTTTQQLDQLIASQPQRLEFFRTRGIVHCFRDEFGLATKDFTHVIRESRAIRRAHFAHQNNSLSSEQRGKGGRKKTGKAGGTRVNGQAPANGTGPPMIPDGPTIDGPDGEPLLLHPSVLPDAPEPIETQCLFLRGAAYLQHAVHLIEEAILKLENVKKIQTIDGAELRLCYVENGKYGGTEIGNPDGPLGSRDGLKVKAYRKALADPVFKDQITSLIKKSLKDHQRFLSHFDTLEGTDEDHEARNLAQKAELAFHLCENLRPNSQYPPPPIPDLPVTFTTYHPLLVESHFSVLICLLMLGEFTTLVPTFTRSALLVDGLEGYPVFLPPRSMSQAEFVEVLERLAGGWKNGVQPHSLSRFCTPSRQHPKSSSRLRIDVIPHSIKAKEVDRAATPPTPSSSSVLSSDDSSSLNQSIENGSSGAIGSLGQSSSSSSAAFLGTGIGVNGSSSSSSSRLHTPVVQQYQIPLTVSTASVPSSSSGRNTPTSIHDFVVTPTATPLPIPTTNHQDAPSTGTMVLGGSAKKRADLTVSLDHLRMLLVPVAARQKERAEKAAQEKAASSGKKKASAPASASRSSSGGSTTTTTGSGVGGNATAKGKKKPMSINIPLHGPRVEILLAWLAAVHLAELDSVA